MDPAYFFPWAVVALAVIIPDAIVTEASRHVGVAASGASMPLKVLDKNQSLQSRQGEPAECKVKTTGEATTTTVTIDEKTLQAKFTCGAGFTGGTVPDLATPADTCCKDQACNGGEKVTISSIIGVDAKAEKRENTVTVTLAKVPDGKRGEAFYYKCLAAARGAGDYCLVAVRLPGPLENNDCAIDRTVALSLSAPETTADFKCSGTLEKSPFVVKTDDSCTEEPAKNAILKLEETDPVGDTKTLGVAELPDTTTKLCYKCVYEEVPTVQNTTKKERRTCNVIVTVAGKEKPAPDSETSTSTSSTSSAPDAYATPGFVSPAVVAFSAVAVNWWPAGFFRS
ncbi:sag-related sequence srs53c [Cystoisospora suis]|uniref:Sag-related sequence srs53c n=1 Tax=Cystoisospora suis TaxID=483139 RepID=A0A2C6L825_9APIC|nr:sag-related sequence srs53c [Cystoisospora suis]